MYTGTIRAVELYTNQSTATITNLWSENVDHKHPDSVLFLLTFLYASDITIERTEGTTSLIDIATYGANQWRPLCINIKLVCWTSQRFLSVILQTHLVKTSKSNRKSSPQPYGFAEKMSNSTWRSKTSTINALPISFRKTGQAAIIDIRSVQTSFCGHVEVHIALHSECEGILYISIDYNLLS